MVLAFLKSISCQICDGNCEPLDVVDFNKTCEEQRGKYMPFSGIPIYYYLCDGCGFCFAPEFAQWTKQDFELKIYNDAYMEFDPDYVTDRPEVNSKHLVEVFKDKQDQIHHLDYGGGNGLLSEELMQSGWQSLSYDPFSEQGGKLEGLGRFNLITAYEVFEHSADPIQLITEIDNLLTEDGVVLFSTLLSEDHIKIRERITWWYASPRNGHVSLYTKKSLQLLGEKKKLGYGNFSEVAHAYIRSDVPKWAQHIISAV